MDVSSFSRAVSVSSSLSFKQTGHREGNTGCNKGETVKEAQTGLLYFF